MRIRGGELCFFREVVFFFFFKRSYLFMIDIEREAETQAEGEAGSMQGARRGTRSRVSGVRPRAEGRC